MRTIFSGGSRQFASVPARPTTPEPVVTRPVPVRAVPAQPQPAAQPQPVQPAPQPVAVPLDLKAKWEADVAKGKNTGIFTQTWRITPALAEMILLKNPGNRTLSIRRGMPRIKSAMTTGRWQHNGESIKIDREGLLNDGQNRLLACVESGTAFTTEVCFGLDRDSRNTVDIGVSRSVQHLLQMGGYQQVTELSGGARVVLMYERDAQIMLLNSDMMPSTDEVITWIIAHEDFVTEDVAAARRIYANLRVPKGITAGLHYLFRKRDPESAAAFFEQLRYGVWPGVTTSDPVYRLREYINNHGKFTGREGHTEFAAVVIKAFNLMRRKERVGALVWRRVGRGAEAFPAID